jgi:hypothetical protein
MQRAEIDNETSEALHELTMGVNGINSAKVTDKKSGKSIAIFYGPGSLDVIHASENKQALSRLNLEAPIQFCEKIKALADCKSMAVLQTEMTAVADYVNAHADDLNANELTLSTFKRVVQEGKVTPSAFAGLVTQMVSLINDTLNDKHNPTAQALVQNIIAKTAAAAPSPPKESLASLYAGHESTFSFSGLFSFRKTPTQQMTKEINKLCSELTGFIGKYKADKQQLLNKREAKVLSVATKSSEAYSETAVAAVSDRQRTAEKLAAAVTHEGKIAEAANALMEKTKSGSSLPIVAALTILRKELSDFQVAVESAGVTTGVQSSAGKELAKKIARIDSLIERVPRAFASENVEKSPPSPGQHK